MRKKGWIWIVMLGVIALLFGSQATDRYGLQAAGGTGYLFFKIDKKTGDVWGFYKHSDGSDQWTRFGKGDKKSNF